MAFEIQSDPFVKQQLEARGVNASVGVFGNHAVQIGKGDPVKLDAIKPADVPFAGFKTATRIARGHEGIRQTAGDALKALAAPGPLDAGKLLGVLKAQQTHFERLDKLGKISQAQKDDIDGSWMFAESVENLSNAELSAVYQKFTSAEMDLLQTGLIREGNVNPKADDARMAAGRLFTLQALVVKEMSNRVSMSMLTDLREANPADATLGDEHLSLPQTLSGQFGTDGAEAAAPATREHDITASNLGLLANVASKSAISRETGAAAESRKLASRGIQGIAPHEMGDVLRAANLTINIPPAILLGPDSVVAKPDEPLVNIWSLADQDITPKGEGYLEKRESVEQILFPELSGHARIADERPNYGALNLHGSRLGAAVIYGDAHIVLKPEVARRATYTVNDSFLSAKVKVTPERCTGFYRLLDGATGVPPGLKAALLDTNSKERADMDAWLARIAADPDATLAKSFTEGAEPASLMNHFSSESQEARANDEYSFQALLIQCFGDSASTRPVMATHDNLESLLPQIGDVGGNALARAAMRRQTGQSANAALEGAIYIEAQIHGPIIPSRDIAEVHVNIDDFPVGSRPAILERLRDFQARTGVKVVLQDFASAEDLQATRDLVNAQNAFNKQHVDQPALDAAKRDILANTGERVEEFLARPANDSYRKNLPEGVELKLDGAILDRFREKFLAALDGFASSPHENSAEDLVRFAFQAALDPILRQKKTLLRGMKDFHFDTPAQKASFAAWVCASRALASVEEMTLVHKHASAQAAALAELAAAEPPPTTEQVLARLGPVAKDFDADCAAYANRLGDKFGSDEKVAELRRVSTMAVSFLQTGEPPADPAKLQRILALVDSPDVRGFIGHVNTIATTEPFGNAPGMGSVNMFIRTIVYTAGALADAAGVPYARHTAGFVVPLSALPQSTRTAIRNVSTELADALDRAHPAHPAFPAPADPAAMPSDKAGRRRFLVDVLEQYRQKELSGPERGYSVHGRGHIARAYIFANAFCNIYAEQGVRVDRNAVILGIAGHDLGRAGLGSDVWEELSGTRTAEAIGRVFGRDAAGEAYEKEIADSIAGVKVTLPDGTTRSVPKSATLEAQMLNNADCLDIGRTAEFDEKYFDFLRDKNGHVSGEAKRIRAGLAKEADLLQRLTNPLCAHRAALDHLILEMSDPKNLPNVDALARQRSELIDGIRDTFIQDAEDIGNEEYFKSFEDTIREHRNLFPLLTKYYLEAEE